MNPNAVGFCWLSGRGSICIAVWWNPSGYTGTMNEKDEPIYGAMQANICLVPGESQEADINTTCNWGGSFPLNIACQLIDEHGGWIKPDKIMWRPKPETNSPLKLKLSYKNSKVPEKTICGKCGSNEGSFELHSCPYACEINDDHSENCNCCENCSHQCAMDV